MHGQRNVTKKGATMRLGSYPCEVISGTKAYKAYGKKRIDERHRHRFEVNNNFKDELVKSGLIISGVNNDLDLVEMIEVKDHPWFVGVQFHPELKSRVVDVHPLFKDFVSAAKKYKNDEFPS